MCDYFHHTNLIELTICAVSVHSGGIQSVMNGETSVCSSSLKGTECLGLLFMPQLLQNVRLVNKSKMTKCPCAQECTQFM